jgi:hypothetical protein
MESPSTIEESSTISGGAGELDRRLNTFAAGAAEENLAQHAASPRAQLLAELSRTLRHMRLDHRRPAAIEFLAQCREHYWVIVSNIVNAVTGEKIQDASAVVGKELASGTSFVPDIHFEQVQ